MPKPPPSPLSEAAVAFDEVLAQYARLAKLFLETPLGSVKHLERSNATLGELAGCEDKLQQAGQRLLAALGEARGRQEQLSHDVIAHAPALQTRNAELRALMDEMGQVAGEVASVNTVIQGEAADREPIVADVSDRVLALSSRAEDLARRANDAQSEEVSTQAHALHQRLAAIAKKLQKAAGN